MTALNTLRSRLQQDDYAFSETLAFVAAHYDYQPSAFRNGDVENAAGQNEGSCKTLGLALLEGLSKDEALRAFGGCAVHADRYQQEQEAQTGEPS